MCCNIEILTVTGEIAKCVRLFPVKQKQEDPSSSLQQPHETQAW